MKKNKTMLQYSYCMIQYLYGVLKHMDSSGAKQNLDTLEVSLETYLCLDEIHGDWWKTFLV